MDHFDYEFMISVLKISKKSGFENLVSKKDLSKSF